MSVPDVREVAALDFSFEPSQWAFAKDNAAEIADHWRRSKVLTPQLFDGRVLLLQRHTFVGDPGALTLRGTYFETSYSAFLAWRDFGFPDASVCNCFSMAALCGDDGAFLLGEMGAHTANPGKIYFAAGTPDLNDIVGDKVDLAGSVMRELGEETGLTAQDVAADDGWTLVLHGPRVACMKRLRSPLSALDLQARIHANLAAQAEPELARMHVWRKRGDVDEARMPEFMRAYLEHVLG